MLGSRTVKTLVINLDRNPDRWEHVKKVMSGTLDCIERMPAVDGRRLQADKWQYLSRWMYLTHEPNKFNIMPAIGCYLSHRKCWQYVVNNELPYALVLEDDLRPMDIAKPFLKAYEANPPSFDWVKLHVNRYSGRDPQQTIGLAIGGMKLCVNPDGSKSTGAYIVSNAGARKLLTVEKMLAPVDHVEWFHLIASIVYVQTHQNLFEFADGLGTNISPHHGNMLRRLPAIARIALVRKSLGKSLGRSNLKAATLIAQQYRKGRDK
jgi:GR25 family glycosyltransferase involved in LPS biosynthesis